MILLNAKIRKETGKKTGAIRNQGRIPAVVYGHNVKNVLFDLDQRDLEKAFKEAGESSLLELVVEGEKEKRIVLFHEFQRDPVTDKFTHIDFLQPSLKEEVEVMIPLVFEGSSLAVKDLGGTLVKSITEVEVKALPQNLPHEIRVSIDGLKTFGDHILIKDLILPKEVTISKKPDQIVVSVAAPQKVEEELAAPVEEDVEKVGMVEKKEKTEEEVVEEPKEAKKEEKK